MQAEGAERVLDSAEEVLTPHLCVIPAEWLKQSLAKHNCWFGWSCCNDGQKQGVGWGQGQCCHWSGKVPNPVMSQRLYEAVGRGKGNLSGSWSVAVRPCSSGGQCLASTGIYGIHWLVNGE